MKNTQEKSIIHYDITVRGRVHHVGFRYSAENMARSYGINGIVKNTVPGEVYLEIEGSKTATDLMIEWCHTGPGSARVDNVIVTEGNLKCYSSFKVVY